MFRILGLISLTSAQQPGIQALPDGLLIETADDINIERGRWTLLITLQTPSLQYGLQEVAALQRSAQHMIDTITLLPEKETAILSHQRRALWRHRLDLILTNASTHFTYDRPRQRRGIINAGGSLLNILFGTVTEDELREVKKQLDLARQESKIANHQINSLVSVINQSRMAEQENRQRINDLTSELKLFQTHQDRNIASFNGLQNAVLLDETLSLMEATEALLYREMHQLEIIQRSLEDGHLSETLFPLNILHDVALQGQCLNLVALLADWYYRNVKICALLLQDSWYMID